MYIIGVNIHIIAPKVKEAIAARDGWIAVTTGLRAGEHERRDDQRGQIFHGVTPRLDVGSHSKGAGK